MVPARRSPSRSSRSFDRTLRRTLIVTAAAAVLLLAAVAPAFADENTYVPTPPDPAPAPAAPVVVEPQLAPAPAPASWHHRRRRTEETSWYGWQTILADGTSLIVVPIIAGTTESEELAFVALGGYLLAPPVIHAAHGRWGIGAASLGLRLGMPTVGALLGAALDQEDDFEAGAAIGLIAGILGASALDAAALSYEKVDEDDRDAAAERARRRGFALTGPTFAPKREGGFALGLGGTF